MLDIDTSLNILKRYGYNSKNVHPYLYLKGKDIGINYSYIDSKYGVVERIFLTKSEVELETFLKKYQWYKLNGKNYGVQLKLNNYEIANPKVLYVRDNHLMTDEEILNIEIYDKRKEKNNKLSHSKRLVVEIESLLDRYYLKKDEIEKYINNYLNKCEELKRYYLELQELINKYIKTKKEIDYKPEIKDYKIIDTAVDDVQLKLAQYKDKQMKEKDAYHVLYRVWTINKNLELNPKYLESLRYNDDIDEELRLVVTKIDYMKELLKKRHLFKKDISNKFNLIDESSTYKSIYDDDFVPKYKEFIEKKYDVIDKVNEFRLCEYLNDFVVNREYDIKRNIERCRKPITSKEKTYDTDIKKVIDYLTKEFNKNLSPKEGSALILYTSVFKKLFDMIIDIPEYNELSIHKLISLLNITDGFNKLYEESIELKKFIELDINKKVKDTIFKSIDFSSKEDFIDSIRKNINIISNINKKIVLKDNIRVYFSTNDINNISKEKLINSKFTINSYMLSKGNNYKVIAADIDKGTNVLFCPYYLQIASEDSNQIEILEDTNPYIMFDTKDILINIDDNDIIFTRFKSIVTKEENYSYVSDFKENYKVNINKVKIEKREDNE